MHTNTQSIHRRRFLGKTLAATAVFSIVPAHVLGLRGATSPNEKLNLACIGIGGRGADDIKELHAENIVALCDVDAERGAKTFAQFPQAKRHQDFRRMLEQMDKEIDAVVVATPDHTHSVAVLQAIRMGKHVFCEKPLAHSIAEVRAMREAARKYKVATQLGNQGHSFDSIRAFREWVEAGAIGTVKEVHAFCGSVYSRMRDLERLKERPPVPAGLDWDLWLGPAAWRPYHSAYVPGKWRSWMPFGTGVIGDWTCHVIDPVFWTLDLGAPTTIEADPGDYDPVAHADTFPASTIIRYEFPAKGSRPAVKIVWYDGSQRPSRPEEMKPEQKLPNIGAIVIGERGKILYGSHGAGGLKLLPESLGEGYQQMPQKLPRSPGHHREWVEACKGGPPAGSNFEYGGPLTELALLGIIAIRLKGQKLAWDSQKGRFTNSEQANHLLKPVFREGWKL